MSNNCEIDPKHFEPVDNLLDTLDDLGGQTTYLRKRYEDICTYQELTQFKSLLEDEITLRKTNALLKRVVREGFRADVLSFIDAQEISSELLIATSPQQVDDLDLKFAAFLAGDDWKETVAELEEKEQEEEHDDEEADEEQVPVAQAPVVPVSPIAQPNAKTVVKPIAKPKKDFVMSKQLADAFLIENDTPDCCKPVKVVLGHLYYGQWSNMFQLWDKIVEAEAAGKLTKDLDDKWCKLVDLANHHRDHIEKHYKINFNAAQFYVTDHDFNMYPVGRNEIIPTNSNDRNSSVHKTAIAYIDDNEYLVHYKFVKNIKQVFQRRSQGEAPKVFFMDLHYMARNRA